jgi:hypothetical protein
LEYEIKTMLSFKKIKNLKKCFQKYEYFLK